MHPLRRIWFGGGGDLLAPGVQVLHADVGASVSPRLMRMIIHQAETAKAQNRICDNKRHNFTAKP